MEARDPLRFSPLTYIKTAKPPFNLIPQSPPHVFQPVTMSVSYSISQVFLAIAIVLSAAGTWAGITPPNPLPDKIPASGDTIRHFIVAQHKYGHLLFLPFGLAALYHAALVLTYPDIPESLLLYGAENGLNMRYVTWSKATTVSLALILCIGMPLRLLSYAGLGKNFTFALSEPDRLNTRGLYRYIQHPSYTGVIALVAGANGLWGRLDGVASCILHPWLFSKLRAIEPAMTSLALAVFLFGFWRRVREEELMLRTKFGSEWEAWHSRTARFIPWVF
ncbi:hypothetical protein F5Y19DRAFT_428558 [Xylariaceae sp. FL1651]|nr:hypothetical protein F5Y19DRAFT_428558 [Xylariaceae sp. FL1651]